MRPFHFDLLKTIQAAAFLLRQLNRQQFEYIALIKLLYFADRECLKEKGHPLTGDRIVAMENGPVLSETLDFVNFNTSPERQAMWDKVFLRSQYHLILRSDPGTDHLTRYETRKLAEIAARYKNCEWKELVVISHDCPEWKANWQAKADGQKSHPIVLGDILRAVGREKDIDEIFAEAKANATVDAILSK